MLAERTVIFLLEFKSMSVEQVRFISGVWLLNEEETKKNLTYFEVSSTSVEPILTKLVMTNLMNTPIY